MNYNLIATGRQICQISNKHPGEHPIKVSKFFILVDFIVLKMEEDVQILIILERPFLVTARVITDVKNGWLTLKVGEEEVEFNLF